MNVHNKDKIVKIFENVFKAEADSVFFAPGRVNLIGEHTDYNGGHVFPCAIDLGTYCAAKASKSNEFRFYSDNFPDNGIISVKLDELNKTGLWADYPIAVVKAFRSYGYIFPHGADMAFFGDLPDGSGLSSSAALEVLTGTVLNTLYKLSATKQELALIGQFAENRFIGVNCGIMDQFASAMGKRDNAVLLDSYTLDYSYAPVPREKASILIVNSGVKHSLASSAYNERRRECETALAELRRHIDAPSLCALSDDEFEKNAQYITEPICRKRARHAVYENSRTITALAALKNGDLSAFGRLMNESHRSLSEDYEVSCKELDLLVKTAQGIDGVLGARMTGGGFGGCTVNLVENGSVEAFERTIHDIYSKETGIVPKIYKISAEDGAKELR